MLLKIFYVSIFLLNNLHNLEAKPPHYEPKPFQSCFEDLGCVSTNELWFHETKRPVNLEPLDRHTIRTNFILFKRNESDQLIYDTMSAKKSSIFVAGFTKERPAIFLIHDFTSNGYTGWIKRLAKIKLDETPNVISVDWESGAEPPYAQAVANARVVALELEALLKLLTLQFGICGKKVKIFGHGLGAHIAGYVGAAMPGISKITALDPSGPFFEGMPNEVKLDSSDAKFVEVIHTDAFYQKSQGAQERMGHIDFYANNAGLQPGCDAPKDYQTVLKLDRNSLKEGQILPDCSHKRAFKYLIETLETPECKFLGIPCHDHEKFMTGKCTSCGGSSPCVNFGVETSRVVSANKLFFNTRDRSPFCAFTYIMEITISEQSQHQTGLFEIMLIGDDNKVSNVTSVSNNQINKYEAGKTYSQIFYASPFKILNIREAKVKWLHRKSTFCVIFCDTGILVKEINVKLLTKKGGWYQWEPFVSSKSKCENRQWELPEICEM